MPISPAKRKKHLDDLLELTSIPTAAGREHRVINWINNWLASRRNLSIKRDRFGNMMIRIKGRRSPRPLLLTAHLDHPAFVVTRILDARNVKLEFRGGVKPEYFTNGRITIHDSASQKHNAKITSHKKGKSFRQITARLTGPTDSLAVDDIATWNLKPAFVRGKRVYTPACDDLAAAAAALAAIDELRKSKAAGDVRILFTRAEEVGFVGAILASESKFIPMNARIIALENSRTFPESPIGAGPIVRVGDRISVFHHGLTFAVTQVADYLTRTNKKSKFKYQRKLMPGGACESTAFQAFGYESMCVCLPLANYHNMGDIDAVYTGTNTKPPCASHESIGLQDFHNLIELLIACGKAFTTPASRGKSRWPSPDGADAILNQMVRIRKDREFILREKAAQL